MNTTTDARNGLLAMSMMCFMGGVALSLSLLMGVSPEGVPQDRLSAERDEAMRMVASYYSTRQAPFGR